jgi:hypothetical protein
MKFITLPKIVTLPKTVDSRERITPRSLTEDEAAKFKRKWERLNEGPPRIKKG